MLRFCKVIKKESAGALSESGFIEKNFINVFGKP